MDPSQKICFRKINQIVACDTLLNHPDFNETFKIHTYSSAFLLVAIVRHKVKPIAFYSIKNTDDQQMYTLTEK